MVLMILDLLSIQQCLRVVGWKDRLPCRDGKAVRCALTLYPLCLPPLPACLRKPIGASGLLALWNQGLSPSQIKLFELEVVFSKKMKRDIKIRAVLSCILFLCKEETAPGMPTATHMWSPQSVSTAAAHTAVPELVLVLLAELSSDCKARLHGTDQAVGLSPPAGLHSHTRCHSQLPQV